jgi:hypothetical protein
MDVWCPGAWFYPALISAGISLVFAIILWSLYYYSISNHKYLAYLGTFEVADVLAAITMIGMAVKGITNHKTPVIILCTWDTLGPLLIIAAAYSFRNIPLNPYWVWAISLGRVAMLSGLVAESFALFVVGSLPGMVAYIYLAHMLWTSDYWTPRNLRLVYALSLIAWIVVDGAWGLPYTCAWSRTVAAFARLLHGLAILNVHVRRLQVERDEAVQEYRDVYVAYRQALHIVALDLQESANHTLESLRHEQR